MSKPTVGVFLTVEELDLLVITAIGKSGTGRDHDLWERIANKLRDAQNAAKP